MRKKWMNYLVTTLLVFLIIFDFKNLSTITITCMAIAIAFNRTLGWRRRKAAIPSMTARLTFTLIADFFSH